MSSFWRPGTIAPGSTIPVSTDFEDGTGINETTFTAAYSQSWDVTKTTEQLRRALPVYNHRQEFLYLVEKHQVVIVVGQTGSGKTTQLPQYLYECGWSSSSKMIACTQPRRIAATSISTRVAEEVGCKVGTIVGYGIRFDEQSKDGITRIKYMTDGYLFRETLFDPLLSRYSVIIIDEAHERSLYTDLLFGLIKKVLRVRHDLRIIISSATLDAEAFKAFFNEFNPAILSVQGRVFPLTIHYLSESCFDVIEEACNTILKVHISEDPGDILVFLPGREEISQCINYLMDRQGAFASKKLKLLPLALHSTIPIDQQIKVFEKTPPGYRKVVVATNVAEASITIDGIVFVIDSGQVKQKLFNPNTMIDVLITTLESQAAARQRAGRAGRVRPGKVFCLFTEDDYLEMPKSTIPEIQKCNLVDVILQLKLLGIDDILRFDFLDGPDIESASRSLEMLFAFQAIDNYGKLTMDIGVAMAELPLESRLSRILLGSAQFQCGDEAATVVAMISAQPIFDFVGHRRDTLEEARRKVSVEEGDLVSYVNIYRSFLKNGPKWCNKHFLNSKSLEKARYIRSWICKYMQKYNLNPREACGTDVTRLIKCLTTGLFANAALLQPDGSYKSVKTGITMYIHPSSILFKRAPACVIYCEVVETTKIYMKDVTIVEPEWLCEVAPDYYEYR